MLYGCYPFSNKEPDYIRKIVTATYHMPPDVQVIPLGRFPGSLDIQTVR